MVQRLLTSLVLEMTSVPQDAGEEPDPLVSIVINNYNYAHLLPRSIESALAQTYPRVEVVVVDDASTDGSADVIRSYADRIIPVLCPRNGGQGGALNAGFPASRGDIVMMLDADDYLHANAAERVVAAFESGVAQVQYRLNLVNPAGQVVDTFPAPELRFDDGDVVPLLLAKGRYSNTVTSGNAFARFALEAIMPMPGEHFREGADGYLVTVVPLFGRVASIDEPLGGYCQHGSNHSGFAGKLAARSRWRIAHDVNRYRALREKCEALGLTLVADPGSNDYLHLESRFVSLLMEPNQHPVQADKRFALALRAIGTLRVEHIPAGMRLALVIWYGLAGVLPSPLARRLVEIRLVASARPGWMKSLLRGMRRLMQRGRRPKAAGTTSHPELGHSVG